MSTHLISRLLGRFRSDAPECAQPQREALLDLMVWVMFADRHIAAPEQAQVQRVARDLPWEGYQSVDLYLDAAVRRARDALANAPTAERYLDDIAARLGDAAMMTRAYQACREVAGADGDIAPAEQALLEQVQRRFGL